MMRKNDNMHPFTMDLTPAGRGEIGVVREKYEGSVCGDFAGLFLGRTFPGRKNIPQ